MVATSSLGILGASAIQMGQGADIEVADPIGFRCPAAGSEKMPHGNQGDIAALFGSAAPGYCANLFIMGGNALHEFPAFVPKRLSGPGLPDVPIAQEWNSADDHLGPAAFVFENEDLIRRRNAADNMDVEKAQHLAGGIEQGWRVMVASNDHHMAARRF